MAVPFLALCMQKKSGVLNRTPLEITLKSIEITRFEACCLLYTDAEDFWEKVRKVTGEKKTDVLY